MIRGGGSGDVYVGDTGDHLVTKFTAAGAVVKTWGDSSLNGPAPQGQLDGSSSTSGAISSLAGVTVDQGGSLDVLAMALHVVLSFAQEGKFASEFAIPGEPDLETEPRGLAVDGAGEFFKVSGDYSVEDRRAPGVMSARLPRKSSKAATR